MDRSREKYRIAIGGKEMRTDYYGPFSTEKGAEGALHRKGWIQSGGRGRWRPFGPSAGDTTEAVVQLIEEQPELKLPSKLPRG